MLSIVRAEVKTWERNFKAKNGRDPSVQDVKDQPEIGVCCVCICVYVQRVLTLELRSSLAEKYKLYKRLSKVSSDQPNDPPSTPKRSKPPYASSIVSNKRTVEQAVPLSSFNPFSPLKQNGKERVISLPTNSREEQPSNPFATPQKRMFDRVQMKEPSPGFLPSIQPSNSRSGLSDAQASLSFPAPTSPLLRARKRLCGEPVSPSPYKEKRRRVASQGSRLFQKLEAHSAGSDETHDLGGNPADSSFVNDSPVKTGGRAFTLLFDEPIPQKDVQTKSKRKFSRSRTTPLSSMAPQDSSCASTTGFGNGANFDLGLPSGTERSNDKRKEDLTREPKSLDPTGRGREKHPRIPSDSLNRTSSECLKSTKRKLSDAGIEPNDTTHKITGLAQFPLLRPSPPPTDSLRSKHKSRDKGKGASRKKAKTLEESDDGSGDGLEPNNVKLVDRRRAMQPKSSEDCDDVYLDSVLRLLPRGEPPDAFANDDAAEFHIDLPDKLRQVLAITPSMTDDLKEERLVRGLLYGKRMTHYDPLKGEIWDVGEREEKLRDDIGAEDDWEDEPVPWEVGEL